MSVKEVFEREFKDNIKREGALDLFNYLETSDFFDAPASSRFHNNFKGGLAAHSLNVYYRLKDLIRKEETISPLISDESIAIVGLLHDLCKIYFYVEDYKKVNENGVWVTRPYFKIDEKLPYGHGEKSVFIIQQYMKLTEEEALAINWHMGPYDDRVKGGTFAFEAASHQSPLVFLAHIADSMATYIDEK